MTKPTIINIMGPTASGKTDLAISLSQHHGCEIISVDSAMVYRDMTIGTAKPSAEELQRAPHRLIDFVDPSEPYSAGRFYDDALREIDDILAANRTPLLVGGTMMYFNALQFGLAKLPEANQAIRDNINQQAQEKGWQAMHAELAKVDPDAANRIHPNDSQRIQRALEVYHTSGEALSALQAKTTKPLAAYRSINIALCPLERSVLHERIAQRFDAMLDAGLIDEVKALRERDNLNLKLPSMRSVGYFEVWRYLDGDISFDEMREQAIAATRQLAKRQLTWLRRYPNVTWFDSLSSNLIEQVVEFLKEEKAI